MPKTQINNAMEKFNSSLHLLSKALKTLDDALKFHNQIIESNRIDLICACQDSILKRFSYTYLLFINCLKRYNLIQGNHSRNIFRESIKLGLCPKTQEETLVNMQKSYRILSNINDFDDAYSLLPDIPDYYHCMKNVTEKIRGNLIKNYFIALKIKTKNLNFTKDEANER